MVKEMGMTEDYKHTMVGVIPEDWVVISIKEITLDMMQGVNTAIDIPEYVEDGIPMLKANNIIDGEINFSTAEHISIKTYKRYSDRFKIKQNDFLFSNIGARLGTGSLMKRDIECSYAWNVMRIIPNQKNVSPDFLKCIMNSPFLFRQIKKNESGSGMGFVPKNILQNLQFPIPPNKSEQAAIATALSDTDALIENLEKLIEKKKNIKQGVMQYLLNPKKNWNEKQLGDVGIIQKGVQLNKDTLLPKGTYPVMNGGIEPSGYTELWNQEPDTIIISEGGNSCGYVNYIKSRFWQGGHCYSVHPKIHKRFLYHLLKFNEKNIMGLRVGSGLPNIQRKQINEFNISYPDSETQISIAKMLDDFEIEIDSLEQKFNKYTMIKQGMMQTLLTGKIRLV